jgi:hypothetical protein
MRGIILILSLLAAVPANAGVYLDELKLDYQRFDWINPKSRVAWVYPDAPKEQISLGMKLALYEFAFSDATILSMTDSSQFRGVGLNERLGVHLSDYVDLYLEHQSLHVLDREQSVMSGFPEQDSVGVSIYLYKRRRD